MKNIEIKDELFWEYVERLLLTLEKSASKIGLKIIDIDVVNSEVKQQNISENTLLIMLEFIKFIKAGEEIAIRENRLSEWYAIMLEHEYIMRIIEKSIPEQGEQQ